MTPGAMRSTGRVFVVAIGPLPSIGRAERVDDAADQRVADRHLDDAAGRADLVAFLDVGRTSPRMTAPTRLLLEVERQADDAARELEQLGRQRVGQAVDARDAVADLDDRADGRGTRSSPRTLDLRT